MKLLVFQHVAHEILGTLDPLLKAAGFRIRYVNFGREPHARPRLGSYDGLVILGGPMNCDQTDRYPHLTTEVEAIRAAIERDIPVLGICLGAQLIARALGATVTANPVKEIGWYDVTPTDSGKVDPLFSSFDGTEKIFQWHGDTFALPDGAIHLATSPSCSQQAFRYGDHVYGLQFHLEVDEQLIDRWLQTPVHVQEIRELGDRIHPESIIRDTQMHIRRSRQLAVSFFGRYIDLFYPAKMRIALPSR